MSDKRVEDLNILSCSRLITPEQLKTELPITDAAAGSVMQGRQVIKDILDRRDTRLFIVVGPCSIHDPDAAMEYGKRLKELTTKSRDAKKKDDVTFSAEEKKELDDLKKAQAEVKELLERFWSEQYGDISLPPYDAESCGEYDWAPLAKAQPRRSVANC